MCVMPTLCTGGCSECIHDRESKLNKTRAIPQSAKGSQPVVFVVGCKTTNPLNGGIGATKQILAIRSRTRAMQRKSAHDCTVAALHGARLHPADLLPCVVTLTRMSAGTMDTDGLAASQKGIRDGIADALGVNDGGRFIEWRYAQRKAKPKTFGVEVRLERRGDAQAAKGEQLTLGGR